ncbi:hypothetical protein [Sphingomonas flavescens]|uniref:hypothetical protein n=1 Tax=Sphingomonas flavescens TaxID=3132797 RepID=UPI002804D6E7|nr:hypothetical protein [Sphingomonas limnosediminicola]
MLDWKLTGYLISSISVLLLGASGWPGAEQAAWKLPALLGGMATSIVGMACREYSHRQEKAAIAYAKREAKKR